MAAGVGGYSLNASGFQMNVSSASFVPVSGQRDGLDCINPLVQDAESWTCDCFEEMQRVCRALGPHDELCMRAQLATKLACELQDTRRQSSGHGAVPTDQS